MTLENMLFTTADALRPISNWVFANSKVLASIGGLCMIGLGIDYLLSGEISEARRRELDYQIKAEEDKNSIISYQLDRNHNVTKKVVYRRAV